MIIHCQSCHILFAFALISSFWFQRSGALTENLIFRADCKLVSEEFWVQSPSDWESFLRLESTRNLFLSAGGKRECRKVASTEYVWKLWVNACAYHFGSGSLPQQQQDLVFVASDTDVQFPGFRMRNTVLNGCQLQTDHSNGRLCHTFCLVGDQKVLQGRRPVVWLVKKLTGLSNDPKQEFAATETKAKTCIYATPSGKQSMKLYMDIEFTTTVTFPKVLMNLLPASKETVEERGSKSIYQVVHKDAAEALNAAREAWINFDTELQQTKVPSAVGQTTQSCQGGWTRGKMLRPKTPFRLG
eukprot:scaffold6708_cov134-Cylindrotheca_fusiformis.AAC.16